MDFFDSSTPSNNEVIEGTPNNDNLSAGAGSNTLTGEAGNDNLSTGGGSNNLIGGAGSDILSTGGGSNTLDGGDGNDSLLTGGGSNNLDGGNGSDTLSAGGGSNTLIGGVGNDNLSSGGGSNILDGGENDDFLASPTSTQGFDTDTSGGNNLTGGSGTDVFFFTKPESSTTGGSIVIIDGEVIEGGEETESIELISTIADFNTSEGDKIQLEASSFDIAPGDTSTLAFNNDTGILSVGDVQAARVVNGVDTDVLANTQVVESGSANPNAENGDATNEGNGGDNADNADGILNVYRFFESQQGFHFYTSSSQERDAVQQQIDNGELTYNYEGGSFSALAEDDDGDPLTGAKPVYRFFNNSTGAHLYTISETEKNGIVENLTDYSLEGVAYYAYDTPQENTIPLYRLYNSQTGTHFFTPSVAERDNVLDTLPQYSEEGENAIAFHVLSSDL